MALIVYADVILPNSVIAAGVRGRQLRRNTRSVNQGGFNSINVVWQRTLRQFDLGITPMLPAQWQALEALFEVTDAGAFGFLMEDPKDSSTSGGGVLQPLGPTGLPVGTVGLGFGVPAYRVAKRYTSIGSSRTKDRAITRPRLAGFALLRDAAPVSIGVAAGNIALDTTTGIVTFVPDATSAATSITAGATTQVVTTTNPGTLIAGQRLFLSGFAGAGAPLVNGLSHVINTVTGSGPFTFTLATVTTGAAITVGAGQGARYPQASQALTWSGNFFVPVHFANDEIDWDMVRSGSPDARLIVGPTVTLMEVRE